MAMLSPVRGLRPWRAGRFLVVNVPNLATATVSSLARVSAMVENTALTTRSAVDLDSETCLATWDVSADLFMRFPPEVWPGAR